MGGGGGGVLDVVYWLYWLMTFNIFLLTADFLPKILLTTDKYSAVKFND